MSFFLRVHNNGRMEVEPVNIATLPLEQIMRETPCATLDESIAALRAVFRLPQNKDVNFHSLPICGLAACVVSMDGLCDSEALSAQVIRACIQAEAPATLPANDQRIQFIDANILYACQTRTAETFGEITEQILNGMAALLVDGCQEALLIDVRSIPHRSVSHTNNESVVLGSQEGFVESLRTNISLVRKHLHSPALITEMIPIGAKDQLGAAIMYVDGVTDPDIVREAKRRLRAITLSGLSGTGEIQQLIEDHPGSLFPQILQTERPDRAASGLSEGQFAILADNSPYALLAPSTLFHFIHASDDTFMRWQYGSFIRLVRAMGILLSLLLPGLYIALTQYHSHLLPMSLLTSIAEARSNVPFPILVEILIMEFSFFLINEAGTRIPSQIGSALGIVGALILGQAAVSASIISPILIIIVALTGLGNFVAPSYSFSMALQLYRLVVLVFGACFGLYGVVTCFLFLCSSLCSMRSFGLPYASPFAPWRPHNPDLVLRLPLWLHHKPLFFSAKKSHKENA